MSNSGIHNNDNIIVDYHNGITDVLLTRCFLTLADSNQDFYHVYRRGTKQVCLYSNSTDAVTTGMYLSGDFYVEYDRLRPHAIDKTGTKIKLGVMVDPKQGYKSQVIYSDPVIPLCATQPFINKL